MQHFYKFVLASIIFVSSIVAKPAVANVDKPIVCSNTGKLDHDVGNCHPNQSHGMISGDECMAIDTENGTPTREYYCVIDGQELCFHTVEFPDGSKGGECFIHQ